MVRAARREARQRQSGHSDRSSSDPMVTYVYIDPCRCGTPDRGAAEPAQPVRMPERICMKAVGRSAYQTRAAGRVMPSARYYREQARVLMELASIASDRGYAQRLRSRAREYLAQARVPEDPALRDLAPYL